MTQLVSLFWIILLFLIFYLLIIRPQQIRLRRRQELIARLKIGDWIETIGGLRGKIVSLDEDTIKLEAAENIILTLGRRAVASRIGDEED